MVYIWKKKTVKKQIIKSVDCMIAKEPVTQAESQMDAAHLMSEPTCENLSTIAGQHHSQYTTPEIVYAD